MATEAVTRLRARLEEPVDAAPLVVFRFLFGALLFAATVRFVSRGWVREHYLEPKNFFPMFGLDFIRPLSEPLMYALFALMGLAALGIAVGALHRWSAAIFGVLFTYVHAIDTTYYLNHYYLVSLLALLLVLLPLGDSCSVDAWRRGSAVGRRTLPSWVLWTVRFQIGCVYFFGGVAKLGPDWIVHAQPLTIWLARNRDVAVIGPLLATKAAAHAMSLAGIAFDLSVPFLLSMRRTRLLAYLALLSFHALTARLFQIGMFPYFMSAFALVFFPPATFRRLLGRIGFARAEAPRDGADAPAPQSSGPRTPWWLAPYAAVQLLVPLRALAYPGPSIWTEEGYKFSWHVMLAEKNGYVEVRAKDKATGREWHVRNADYVTREQERQMAAQPEMLVRFAKIVHDSYAAQGRDVSVYVSSEVSLNGRPRHPLVDREVDLAAEHDGFAAKRWILPAPTDPPRF